ncbi:MAG: hypothetical protein WBJ75_13990 [Pseudohongiellaceae bacterium]
MKISVLSGVVSEQHYNPITGCEQNSAGCPLHTPHLAATFCRNHAADGVFTQTLR